MVFKPALRTTTCANAALLKVKKALSSRANVAVGHRSDQSRDSILCPRHSNSGFAKTTAACLDGLLLEYFVAEVVRLAMSAATTTVESAATAKSTAAMEATSTESAATAVESATAAAESTA